MNTFDHNSKTILVVDDDPDILRGTCLRLRAGGFLTIQAVDGEAAITEAIAEQPCAILLDVRMPKMNGLAVLRKLSELPATSHIPVVILSASVVDRQQALDSGARFFLAKPYDGARLLDAVRAVTQEQPQVQR